MKKIFPFGMSDYEKIITRDRLYVDKTRLIYKMISENDYIFLSRPRRFGKSLTLSTIDAIFSGKKELFTGTFMETADWDWETYPVLRFDFSTFSEADDIELLRENIISDLN
ncbi:MAG: AAA family ATPase, partial [Spirochaetales bacterium]|nr:AAA family ATPase [Spirochaetales bacterium]